MNRITLAIGLGVVALSPRAGPLHAQAKQPLTFDKFLALQIVGDAQLSPDGASVAFTVTLPTLAASRVLTSFLYEITPQDPVTHIVASSVLLAVALLASWLPARRAARVDPMVALRYE